MNEKKYVGSGKKVGNYDLINFTIAEDKVKDAWFDYNGKKYLRLTIGNKKESDQYGKTHSVWLDEYKPEDKVEQSSKPEPNLPF